SMHERKKLMSDSSEAFLAIPGGFGTLDEMFEALTWAQLGIHSKPIGFLDAEGFYAPLMAFLDSAVEGGFVRAQYRAMAIVDVDPAMLLRKLASYEPPRVEKWISGKET
ncbi:MAG: TIGR00730 family Rossman fold protein, partial [bacterium]